MQKTPIRSVPFSNEELESGRHLFSKDCDFITGCATLDQIPDISITEVAFGGRSNVGKSSLINALVNQKALARISNTPGRTREINFFNLSEQMVLTDLPGYGYARAPKLQIKKWTNLVNTYLKGRANLRRTFVLIDSRHGLKHNDYNMLKMLDKAAQSYQLILTKCDKINPTALISILEKTQQILNHHPAAYPKIIWTSSKTGEGLPELRAALVKLAPID